MTESVRYRMREQYEHKKVPRRDWDDFDEEDNTP